MSEDIWGRSFKEFMGVHPHNVLTTAVQQGIMSVNEARATYEDSRSNDRPLWSRGYGYSPGRTERRCRYCKHLVHGDACSTCGAPQ